MVSQMLDWHTILDILVIAAGMFFLYRTLMRLGTWKIVSGILVAALVFIAANSMDLEGVEWIYRNLSHVAVLSIIVLFQPELRKFFEQTASIRQTRGKSLDEYFSSMIADSMWQLSKKGIGAIIVIPGHENIDQWSNGGFTLDGRPSLPLIMSIFDPHSPGHDGALIIKNGKFASFGVRIPVSQSGRLSDEYGTRHQAAMGLSEKSDALVVVVSEERHQVSIFRGGIMKRMTSERAICETVMAHCRESGLFQQLFIGKRLYSALGLEAVGSLAAAAAFWVIIVSGQGEMMERVITVPVEYTATAEDVVMTGDKAREAKLHLSGSKSDLDAVSSSLTSVKINISKATVGKQSVVINEENVRLPKGVRLVDVEPSNIEINIAKLAKATLPVKPQLVGSLPPGLNLVSISTSPEHLTVFIPADSGRENFKSITTTPVYLDSIRGSTTIYCKVVTPPSIQPVDKRWPDVEVILNISADAS